MAHEITIAIIKPDAVLQQSTGAIIELIERNGFVIQALEKKQWTRTEAEAFYAVHAARSFFKELIDFMTSGPIICMALAGENAVAQWRTLMGDTNPATAAPGTIRRMFGTDIGKNATHGSDSIVNAQQELKLLFPELT